MRLRDDGEVVPDHLDNRHHFLLGQLVRLVVAVPVVSATSGAPNGVTTM